MCFTVHDKHPFPKISFFNKRCYKVVIIRNDIIYSFYMDYKYILNKKMRRVKLRPFIGLINSGYHSYSNFNKAHCMSMSSRLKEARIIECVIPRFSKYYYNPETEEYVSSSIIVKRIL